MLFRPVRRKAGSSGLQAFGAILCGLTFVGLAWAEDENLLRKFDVTRDRLRGSFERQGADVVTGNMGQTLAMIPGELPRNYRLRVTAERLSGSDSLNIGLVVAGRPVVIVLEGFGGRINGLNTIDSSSPDRNETRNETPIFTPGKGVVIECTVQDHELLLTAGGRKIIDWKGRPERLGTDRRFFPPDAKGLLLGSWNSAFRIAEVTLTTADRPTEPRVASTSPGTIPRPKMPREPAETTPTTPSPEEPTTSVPTRTGLNPPGGGPVMDKARASLALVQSPTGTGSGFVIGPNLVATASHVVNGSFAEELELHFQGSGPSVVKVKRVVYEDEARDLCLLEAQVERPALTVAANHEFVESEPVSLMGNPSVGGVMVLRGATTEGRLTALVRLKSIDFYQIDGNVNPGSSGGPALNRNGQVVAVVAMKANANIVDRLRRELQNLDDKLAAEGTKKKEAGIAFGVPASVLEEALRSLQQGSEEVRVKANDEHDARIAVRRIAALGVVYFQRAQTNVSSQVRQQYELRVRQAAMSKGGAKKPPAVPVLSVQQAERLRRELTSDTMQKLEKGYSTGMRKQVERLAASPHLSSAAKSDLDAFFKTLQQLSSFANSPADGYQQFSSKIVGFEDKMKEQIDRLQTSLKMEE